MCLREWVRVCVFKGFVRVCLRGWVRVCVFKGVGESVCV